MDTQSKPAAVGLPLEAAWAPQSPLHSHTSALMHEPLLNDVPLAAVMQALGQLAVASDAPVSMSTNGGGSSLLHSRARFSQPTGDARLPRGSQYGGLDTNALRHAYSMPSMGWSSPQPSFTSPLLQNMDPSTLASLLSAPAAPDRHQATACEELLLAGLAPLNPQSRMPGSPNQQPSSPNSLYKTELCRTWQETGSCRYGGKCQFAHGCEELRPVQRHPKYKTEICRTFATTGTCPYGTRCRFIHYYAKPTACTGLPLQPMRDQTQLPRAASSTYGGRIDRSQSPGLGNGFGQGLGNMLLGHEVEIMLMQAQAHQAAGGSQEIYMPPLPPTSSSGTLAGLPSLTCTPSFDSHGGAPSPLNAATNIAPYDSTRLPVFKNFTPE